MMLSTFLDRLKVTNTNTEAAILASSSIDRKDDATFYVKFVKFLMMLPVFRMLGPHTTFLMWCVTCHASSLSVKASYLSKAFYKLKSAPLCLLALSRPRTTIYLCMCSKNAGPKIYSAVEGDEFKSNFKNMPLTSVKQNSVIIQKS